MKRTNSLNKLVKIIVLATALLALLGGCGKKKTTIDLATYTTVEITGYNTEGHAKVNFDIDSLYAVIAQSLYENKIISDVSLIALEAAYETDPEVASLLDTIDSEDICTADQSSDLTNGDDVTVTYHFNNDAFKGTGIILQGENQTYAVENLPEIETYDPFENLKVDFTGISPLGHAAISNSPDGCKQNDYKLSKVDFLKNGDTITVTYDAPEEAGRTPSETEMEYTVSGLPEYITDASAIPSDAWEKLKNEAADVKSARIDICESLNLGGVYIESIGDWATQISDIYNWKWEKAYLLTRKEGTSGRFENRILLVYSFDTDKSQGNIGAFYLDDLVLETDGSMLIPGGDMKYTYAYKGNDAFVSNVLNEYAEDYESVETEIGWTN